MFAVEKKQVIRIKTLENNSLYTIKKWIKDCNDNDELVQIKSQTEIWIGDIDYRPIKWQCTECKRWNYQLQYCDPSGAIAICNYCKADGEL